MNRGMKGTLVSLSFALMTACQSASSESTSAMPVGSLIEQYEKSSLSVRNAYDGKEITVRGYTNSAAVMPGDRDQGSVMLHDENVQPGRAVTCWFSRGQITEFSKIKGRQYVTVKGVFTGERGAELKFCKLIKIE
jgi:tRNA_anti-like